MARFEATHLRSSVPSGLIGVPSVNAQLERISDTTDHRSRRATTPSAAPQCSAWLSPTSATVRTACAGGTPNLQALIGELIGSQGAPGVSNASLGRGRTIRFNLGLWQR